MNSILSGQKRYPPQGKRYYTVRANMILYCQGKSDIIMSGQKGYYTVRSKWIVYCQGKSDIIMSG